MGLQMKGECGRCHSALMRESEAYICVHECTFCAACTDTLRHVCPNCEGELVRRPRPGPVRSDASGPAHA